MTSVALNIAQQVSAAAESGADEGALALRDVHFGYPDGTAVLDGVSTTIKQGEIVGIVGPSGCGKSTLLYLVAQLLIPTGGRIERRVGNSPRHELSMVFQKDTLLPWLTVAENVRFFARFKKHGLRGSRIARLTSRVGWRSQSGQAALDERVRSLLRLVKLDDRGRAYPYQLSGGMRRRLAFLAGVAPHPEILLLDEPFSSVDEPTRIGIHQDVFKIMRTLNMTTILVTHDLAEAITLCDRVIILSNRPASVAHQHVIPFGRERDMLHIRARPEFLELYGQLWDDLSAQIQADIDREVT